VRVLLGLASLGLFAMSLLSKEIAIVFPALLAWAAVLERRGYAAILPSLAVAGLYLYARQQLLGSAVVDFAAREAGVATADPGTGGARPLLHNLFTQARVIAAYVALFLVPVGLCIHRHVRVSNTPFEAGVIGGVALIGAMLYGAWRWRRSRPAVSLGIVWFLVSLAPTSSVIPLNQVMNEHRLYLPGVGVALVVGALFARPSRARWLVPAAAAVLCALTLHRNLDWNDPVRLWASAVRVSPESDGAWNSYGAQLRMRGRFVEAEDAFERALELNGHGWDATFNLGTLYLARARESDSVLQFAKAHAWLEKSLEIRPDSTRSRWYLAELAYARGRLVDAEGQFRALAGINPRLYEMTRYPLARIASQREDLARARALYEEALRHGTDPVAARLGLARLAKTRGDDRAAVAEARRAMEARPQAHEPHLFLARLRKGSPAAARHLFEAERRGYRVREDERRALLGEGSNP
jgi:tetratricopeptide (TPR) repeat protein